MDSLEYIIIVVFIISIIIISVVTAIIKDNKKWVDTNEFVQWKMRISKKCNEQTLREYMEFLEEYKGGYIKRQNGHIVYQEFLGKEKGDLKGIFYNIIVPSRYISIKMKEEFRRYLCKIGVNGVNRRPIYEMRNGKLKADVNNKEEYNRKVVGNRGELKVREALKKLNPDKYFVVSGIMLKMNDQIKEFDHIVISDDAMFILETKAFGMAEREDGYDDAVLYIDQSDNWKLRKYGKIRAIKNPTKQIKEQRCFIKEFADGLLVDLKCILVLSNNKLKVKQNGTQDYEIFNVEEAVRYIENYKGIMNVNDKLQLICKIDKARVN